MRRSVPDALPGNASRVGIVGLRAAVVPPAGCSGGSRSGHHGGAWSNVRRRYIGARSSRPPEPIGVYCSSLPRVWVVVPARRVVVELAGVGSRSVVRRHVGSILPGVPPDTYSASFSQTSEQHGAERQQQSYDLHPGGPPSLDPATLPPGGGEGSRPGLPVGHPGYAPARGGADPRGSAGRSWCSSFPCTGGA